MAKEKAARARERDLTLGRTDVQRTAVRELQALLELGVLERLRRAHVRAGV